MKIIRANAKKELSPEEVAYHETIGDAIERAFQAEQKERNESIEKLTGLLGTFDEGQNVAGVVRALAQKLDETEKKLKRSLTAGDKNKLRRALEDKKDQIQKIMRGDSREAWRMEFNIKRAASAMMTTSTVITGAVADDNPNQYEDVEIELIRYPRNFILDAVSSRQVSKVPERWGWKEQVAAGDGVISTVTEGSEKTLVDYKFEWKYNNRKKYAGRIEMTEELEMDFEQLVMDIIDMFESQVLRAYNDGVLTDILAWAPVYSGTALDGTITKPALMNVVSAGQLQLASNSYVGDVLVMNPADYATTQNMQNVNGDPIFVPDNVIFPGVRLFVTNKITSGTVLLGEGSIVKEQHGPYIIRQGQYADQFIENEKTIVGEIFSVLKLPTESKKGWVKLDVSTVKDALQVGV